MVLSMHSALRIFGNITITPSYRVLSFVDVAMMQMIYSRIRRRLVRAVVRWNPEMRLD